MKNSNTPVATKNPRINKLVQLSLSETTELHGEAQKRFESELRVGKSSGNFYLTTGAGLRLSVLTWNPSVVQEFLLNEMGISTECSIAPEHLKIKLKRFDLFSGPSIMRELFGSFRAMQLMHEDGAQAVIVMGLKNTVQRIG